MLVIFSGCSGVGKNTVINQLLEKHDNFAYLPAYATRAMRPGEKEGAPYHFISDEAFREKIAMGDLYEYEEIHNHFYGTPKSLLQELNRTGKIIVKDVDVKGAQNLKKILGGDMTVLSIFLYVDSFDTLVKRLQGRGETDIELRLKRYQTEMAMMPYYDYPIVNDKLEDTVATCEKIIFEAYEKEKSRQKT